MPSSRPWTSTSSVHGALSDQRREDRQRDADEVERQQRQHARHAPHGRAAQQERQRRRALAADVALGGARPRGAADSVDRVRARRRRVAAVAAWTEPGVPAIVVPSRYSQHAQLCAMDAATHAPADAHMHGGLRERRRHFAARSRAFSRSLRRRGSRRRPARSCAAGPRAATPPGPAEQLAAPA